MWTSSCCVLVAGGRGRQAVSKSTACRRRSILLDELPVIRQLNIRIQVEKVARNVLRTTSSKTDATSSLRADPQTDDTILVNLRQGYLIESQIDRPLRYVASHHTIREPVQLSLLED